MIAPNKDDTIMLQETKLKCNRCGQEVSSSIWCDANSELKLDCWVVCKDCLQVEAHERAQIVGLFRTLHTGLRSAVKLYCGWYDTGTPKMSASNMAYELYSAISELLWALNGGPKSD